MGKSSSKTDPAIGCLAIVGGAILIFSKIFLVLFPIIFLAGAVYYYFKWQSKKLAFYNNDWASFYKHELKEKLIIAALIVPGLLGISYYFDNYKKQLKLEKIEILQADIKKKQNEEEQIKLALQAKIDSSQYFLKLAESKIFKNEYKLSLLYLDSSLIVVP